MAVQAFYAAVLPPLLPLSGQAVPQVAADGGQDQTLSSAFVLQEFCCLLTLFIVFVILLTRACTLLGRPMGPWGLVFTAAFKSQSNFKILKIFTHDFFKYFFICA